MNEAKLNKLHWEIVNARSSLNHFYKKYKKRLGKSEILDNILEHIENAINLFMVKEGKVADLERQIADYKLQMGHILAQYDLVELANTEANTQFDSVMNIAREMHWNNNPEAIRKRNFLPE